MVTRPEAYSMLDSARAAVRSQRNLSGKVILLGQSQGTSAAFAADGFAPDYAPDLDIRGAVTTGKPYVWANDPDATSRGGDPKGTKNVGTGMRGAVRVNEGGHRQVEKKKK